MSESYEGSARQRKRMRRARLVAVILALSLLIPIVAGTYAAIAQG